MESREIKRKRAIVEVVVTLVCLCLIVGFFTYHYTVARYSDGTSFTQNGELKDFDVDMELRYNDGVEHVVRASELSNSHGILRLTADQYETLKLDTVYKGEGKCYYRFKITESWLSTTSTLGSGNEMLAPRSLSNYNLSGDFYDNRSYDGYIYCKQVMTGEQPSTEIVTRAINECIPGEDATDLLSDDDKANVVDISVEIEGVQWNRAKEVWGLSKLPWE